MDAGTRMQKSLDSVGLSGYTHYSAADSAPLALTEYSVGGSSMTLRGYVFKSILLMVFLAGMASAGTFAQGDVLVAIGNSEVNVFTPTGTLVTTLNDASGSTFTTGMVFDASGNLYVTNFSLGTVSQFDPNGNLLNSSFMAGGLSSPESILVNMAGNFYVTGPSAAQVNGYSAAGGSPTNTYNVQGGNGTGGTDWSDLAADQKTLLYDGEGTEILSYNLATQTQNAAFATGLPGSSVFEFRIIPGGAFSGDILAADSSAAILLSPTGTVLKTYSLPGNQGVDFALNLDPNGTDFWTADATSGNIWEVNISTGAIDSQFNSGAPGTTFGLVVAGQITAGGPPGTPEPATFGLFASGIVGLALWARRKRRTKA
jgi:hypothetical protein